MSTFDMQSISQDLMSFLTKTGLPKEGPLLVTCYEREQWLELTDGEENYLIVGDDSGTKIGLKAEMEDVWSIDPDHQLPRRFINRDLRRFVLFLDIHRSHQPDLRVASDQDAANIVEAIRSEFSRIDPHSVDDPENWWSVILEETKQGLT